ncbi:MAG: hypothetical protein KA240_16305 [Nitrospira sp.]|nr:hypothetical protein [Nitrospira sp.]
MSTAGNDPIGELVAEVRALRHELAEIREPILRVATRRETRAEMAKRLGVSPRTISRRRRRERIRLMVEGKL